MCENLRAGNLLLASTLLLSGNSYTKVGMMFRFFKLQYFKDVLLSGDGRNDSPGHSAQYCTYSLADMEDKAILQMNILDVREAAGKSNNMEQLGFVRGMDKLLTSPMSIKEVVTDGHLGIAALMSMYCTIMNET